MDLLKIKKRDTMVRIFGKFFLFVIWNCLISLSFGFGRAYCDEFQYDSTLIVIVVLEGVDSRETCFSEDGRYLINKYTLRGGGREDRRCSRIWSVPEFEEIKTLTAEDDWVRDIICSPDGKYLMSANTDKSVSIWKLPEVSEVKKIKFSKKVRALQYNAWDLFEAHFSPDGQYCAAIVNYNVKYRGEDESAIIVWQVSNWKEIKTLKEKKNIKDLIFLPDNTLCSSNRYLYSRRMWVTDKAWRLPNFKSVKCLKGETAFSKNGKYLAIREKNKINIRQISNFKEIETLKLPEEKYRNIVISNDGQYLVIEYRNYIELYKAPYTEEPNVLRISGLGGVEFALNSKYLLAHRERKKNDKIWRLSDFDVREMSKTGRSVLSCDSKCMVYFYRDERYGVKRERGVKIRYESDFFEEELILYSHLFSSNLHSSFCFSPDGRYLAVTAGDKIYILQVPLTKESLKEFAGKMTLEKAKEDLEVIKSMYTLQALKKGLSDGVLSKCMTIFEKENDTSALREAKRLKEDLESKLPNYTLMSSTGKWNSFCENVLMASEGKIRIEYWSYRGNVFRAVMLFEAKGYKYEIQTIENAVRTFLELTTGKKLTYYDFSELYTKLGMQASISDSRKGYNIALHRTGDWIQLSIYR